MTSIATSSPVRVSTGLGWIASHQVGPSPPASPRKVSATYTRQLVCSISLRCRSRSHKTKGRTLGTPLYSFR